MTDLYLALGGASRNIKSAFEKEPAPGVLCSYVYYDAFKEFLKTAALREWVLDSGAFTAWKAGKPIDLQAYIEFCQQLQTCENAPKEIYALDVVGDWKASLKNTEAMWKAGVHAIPTFHINEPEGALMAMARDYPKIALGGVAGMGKRALPWLNQCFARVWPKPMHVFGIHSADVLLSLPFHSADATNWQLAPTAFGRWACYGGADLKVRKNFHLRPQVDMFLDLEAKLKAKWGTELESL